jgi:hypothetical protein
LRKIWSVGRATRWLSEREIHHEDFVTNELVNDYNKRLRIDNFVGMTGIPACFDRILPSIILLLNRQNGCPKEAVTMHVLTLRHANYLLKTQQGVSEKGYSNATGPVYGNGQGAGDSPSQWRHESAMLFQINQEMEEGATMSNRSGESKIKIHLAAFADDTNLLGNNNSGRKSRIDMIKEVKQAFTTWDGLLHATGHSMELSKFSCSTLNPRLRPMCPI